MSLKTWWPRPIHVAVMELLSKKGALLDTELHELLKSEFSNVSFRTLNKSLLRLEIEGKIIVSSYSRKKRRVEIIEKGKRR